MKISLKHIDTGSFSNIATRCPHCGYNGTFIRTVSDLRVRDGGNNVTNFMGIKKCPNERCDGYLFFIEDSNQNLLLTSPSDTIPFDSINIPSRVLEAFSEAIKCHSNNCFVASAIMIRKTLEEICLDRKAGGGNLKEKVIDLGNKILIPKDLIDGMDDLRLLGNDAAHIEARTFNEIGKDEVEISIEFAKEILKAVYQYESLVLKIKSLKAKRDAK